MNIYPAIDLVQGKAVRLVHGDFDQMTIYSDVPVEVAKDFLTQGAQFLHVVDLEGARDGEPRNEGVIARIIQESGLIVEVGGGIRDKETIEKYLAMGARQVILGTAALEDADFLHDAVDIYGESIVIGVDVKDGFVAVEGWRELSDMRLDTFLQDLSAIGVGRIICTDISRDGAMAGANRDMYRELVEEYPVRITASGGVSTLDDIRALRHIGVEGAIIGKALYTGGIDLTVALHLAKGEE